MGKRKPPHARPRAGQTLPLLPIAAIFGLAAAIGLYYHYPWQPTATNSAQKQPAKQDEQRQQQAQARAAEKLREAQVGLGKIPNADGDVDGFRTRALPLLYAFIFSNYDAYASSKLTFRDMKQHLADQLGMTYELLRTDEYSAVVEDAVDALTNECRGGVVAMERCARKFGLDPSAYRSGS